MGRGLNWNDPGPSCSSTFVVLGLRRFGIPEFSALTVQIFQVCSWRQGVTFFPAVIFIPGNPAAWDESAWNLRRVGSCTVKKSQLSLGSLWTNFQFFLKDVFSGDFVHPTMPEIHQPTQPWCICCEMMLIVFKWECLAAQVSQPATMDR